MNVNTCETAVKSVPAVAEPAVVATVTLTASVEAFESFTVKFIDFDPESPSVAITLSDPLSIVKIGSSFVIVPIASEVPNSAPLGLLRITLKVSSISAVVSPLMVTVRLIVVVLGRNVISAFETAT